ncbi:MAG: hypothetical protein PWP34_376 [Desulfuromonadales bacterium]|nr:hypothetical protein [Desulfuromonadales bacterium]
MVSLPDASPPELSVIVPFLNEGEMLPSLIRTLQRQQGVKFELILCDGGSEDDSHDVLSPLLAKFPYEYRLYHSPPGRARQLNFGAASSRGNYLLFLHADSTFEDSRALARAYSALHAAHCRAGHCEIAGHFPLFFRSRSDQSSWAFFHHAWKTRLHRPYCVHGDQGFMLARSFFEKVGPFDESLPFLEDVRLAKSIENRGRWLLFPTVLETSARRFEEEGFGRRQALNAMILACEEAGYGYWLADLPGIYRQQAACKGLRLYPFFKQVSRHVSSLSLSQKRRLWRTVGAFVCGNVWQLAFMVDTLRHYRSGKTPGLGPLNVLRFFDRRIAWMIDHPVGYWIAAFGAWVWYRWNLHAGYRS